MLLFLLLQAEIEVVDNKFEALKENQEEVKKGITGEEKSAEDEIRKTVNPKTGKPAASEYKSAKICISQGGLPPSGDTSAADMRNIHDAEQQQPNRHLDVACRSRDVFEQADIRLREPEPVKN